MASSTDVAEAAVRARLPGLALQVAINVLLVAVFLSTALGVGDDPTWIRVLFAVLAATLAASLPLTLRAVVEATPAGLMARSIYGRRRQLSWPEVHHFEMRGYRRGVGVWTVDGRWIHLLPYGSLQGAPRILLQQLEAYRWQRQQELGLA